MLLEICSVLIINLSQIKEANGYNGIKCNYPRPTPVVIVPGDSQNGVREREELAKKQQQELESEPKRVAREVVRVSAEASRDAGMSYCQSKYTEEECQDLDFIFQHESGWVVGRWNQVGCAGLGQACPKQKLGEAYGSLEGEIDWFYDYAISRYQSTHNAKSVWERQRWW